MAQGGAARWFQLGRASAASAASSRDVVVVTRTTLGTGAFCESEATCASSTLRGTVVHIYVYVHLDDGDGEWCGAKGGCGDGLMMAGSPSVGVGFRF